MQYVSTQNRSNPVSLVEAVLKGLAPDNGLYMPAYFEQLPVAFYEESPNLSFSEIAYVLAKQLLKGDLPDLDLKKIIDDAITFDASLFQIGERVFALELFHGPTLAFKDFAARFMAKLLSYILNKLQQPLTILVATSGDTGSAVAQGFLHSDLVDVVILYPSGKVSPLQEKQLTTMGSNIQALEIQGSFDDCQKLVKQAFLDKNLTSNQHLSSANSINIARLIPQSFYYVYAYSRLKDHSLPLVFSVPCGNFGNLTAGLMAKKLGCPIFKFIAATNSNSVVPEYLESGIFCPRPSVQTISNAMDVGNPSNFARMQFLFNNDLNLFKQSLYGCSFTDLETKVCIKNIYDECKYVLDPHGAVAYLGLKKFESISKDEFQGVFLETAHPAKFSEVVNDLLRISVPIPDRLAAFNKLKKQSILMPANYNIFKSFLEDRKKR